MSNIFISTSGLLTVRFNKAILPIQGIGDQKDRKLEDKYDIEDFIEVNISNPDGYKEDAEMKAVCSMDLDEFNQ